MTNPSCNITELGNQYFPSTITHVSSSIAVLGTQYPPSTIQNDHNSVVQEDGVLVHYTSRLVKGVFLLIWCVLGITGNALVIISVILSRKLRTSTNVFIVSLAAADLLTCMLMPIFCWSLWTTRVNEIYIPLDHICAVAFAFIQFCIGCSICTLASIALNRMILITKCFDTYQRMFSPRNLMIWIIGIWIFVAIPDILPLVFGIGGVGFDHASHICASKADNDYAYIYDAIIVVGYIPIPLLIIVICYIQIFIHVRQHNKKILGMEERYPPEGSSVNTITGSESSRFQSVTNVNGAFSNGGRPLSKEGKCTKVISRSQIEITKNLFYIICTFVVCLTPHLAGELLSLDPNIVLFTKVVVVLNSCINPIIYAIKHPHFRRVFLCILRCRFQDIPEPAEFIRNRLRQKSYQKR